MNQPCETTYAVIDDITPNRATVTKVVVTKTAAEASATRSRYGRSFAKVLVGTPAVGERVWVRGNGYYYVVVGRA